MKADDRPIVEAISRGSKAAFVTLFEFTSGAVRAELAARLPDAQRATVFAATHVEVWWLAGCHCGPGVDVVAWIGQIVDRRIADVDAYASPRSLPLPTSADRTEDPWPSRAELELAALLGRPCDTLWPT